jgi:translin
VLNKKEFATIRREFSDFEQRRERAIQASRRVITLSKQVIYAVQRSDLEHASRLLKQLMAARRNIPKERYDNHIQDVAIQEYVEAVTFYEFIRKNRLPTKSGLKVSTENYLLGLCDLTGELVRKAVQDIINERIQSARSIHALVEEIYGEFLKFDLRNGELRKKMDGIKWNLKKLDDLMYDVKKR